MQGIDYHIHINHFLDKLPDCIDDLLSQNFRFKEATLLRNGNKSPLWLIAKKLQSAEERDETYKKVLALVQSDRSFSGYMESETVVYDEIITDVLAFNDLSMFPISDINLIDKPKSADIHIYRDKATRDKLDDLLENNGFYEVQTNDKKIWTLLIEDCKDSKYLYSKLYDYFKISGGVLELELEYIKDLNVLSKNYSLPQFIKPISFKYAT